MHSVCLLVLPAAADLDLAICLDVFRIANDLGNKKIFAVDIATLDGNPARLTNGRTIAPTLQIADTAKFDLGLALAHIHPGPELLPIANKVLRRLARVSAVLAGADYGPLLMASAGLLDGYRAACHKDLLEAAQETYPFVSFVDELFVIERDRLTCAGHLSMPDMLIHYISKIDNAEFAEAVASELILAGPRPPHTPQRTGEKSAGIDDARILAAINIMAENLETPVSITEIANRVGLSQRFMQKIWKSKMGCSPYRYYARERINRGCSLLLFSKMPIEEIAFACGYSSSAVFSRAFSEFTGSSPREYRARHENKIAPAISLSETRPD